MASETGRSLTKQQQAALDFLREYPGATTKQLVADAQLGGRCYATIDWAHGLLTRLEQRGLVRRTGKPAKWSIAGTKPKWGPIIHA